MHYWNRDNFEGLEQLASRLRSDPLLDPLARYCELRASGLRADALAALNQFLDDVLRQKVEVQRAVTLRVLDAHWRAAAAHQFLSHPLRQRFIEPVLVSWAELEPLHPRPLAELALLRRDEELLGRAIQLNPQDSRVRAMLAALLLGHVEYATHHLVEGKLIGTSAEAAATLETVEGLIRGASEEPPFQQLAREAVELRQLLDDWNEYSMHPVDSFPEWCRAHNRLYDWPSIVYYDA